MDGSKIVGPSFKGLYGSSIEVTSNGEKRKITVDDLYIKSSIYEPNKDIAESYQQGIMKSYTGIIKDKDIPKINEYLKSLKTK